MSIFKTEECPICGENANAFQKSSVKYDGLFICSKCFKKINKSGVKVLQVKKMELDELRRIVCESDKRKEEQEIEINNFNITKRVDNYFYVDENQGKFAVPKLSLIGTVKGLTVYDYSDIVDFELLEDGNSISKGGVGRAIVGGILFGDVGAIVGGSTGHKQKKTCTMMHIKITVNDINHPVEYIKLIQAETKKDSFVYKSIGRKAQEILSLLDIICKSNK